VADLALSCYFSAISAPKQPFCPPPGARSALQGKVAGGKSCPQLQLTSVSQRWTRGDKIGVGSLVVAIVAVAIAILTPEIRQATHLDTNPESAHVSVEQSQPHSVSDTKATEDRLKAPRITRKEKPASPPPSFTQNCGGGNCAISSGQTGGITASIVNIDTDRNLLPDDATKMLAKLENHQGTVAISALGDVEETNLAMQLRDALIRASGWGGSHLEAAHLFVGHPVHGIEVRVPKGQEESGAALVEALRIGRGLKGRFLSRRKSPEERC